MSLSDKEQWARVQARLRAIVGEDNFKNWFGAMEHDAISDDVVRLSLPTRFLKSWVQSHYADKLLACWKAEMPSIRRIDLVHRSAVLRDATVKVKPNEPIETVREIKNGLERELRAAHQPAQAAHEALGGSPLDPRLAFDTFVVGRSNTLAHAAAKQVALARRGEPVMFNPLYVHAGVGLGKTHLLQAIAWAGNGIADRKVLYLTAEKFMYGFVAALKSQTALAFKEALRGIDVLVIDDLQFLQGKSTQAEFCHTLNALIDGGRQVVIAADRPPSDLESLDDRVRSRLAGGLVVEMGSLEEELRLEILKSRAAAARAHHPGFDVPAQVLAFVAKQITHNGRDLDGALNRLLASNKLTGLPDHHGHGRARGARPDPPAGAQARQDRGHSARGGPAIQCEPLGPSLLAPHRQCGASAPDRDVSGQDPDPAFTARDRAPFRRARPHHRAACGAQDRKPGRQRQCAGRGDRAAEAPAAGIGAARSAVIPGEVREGRDPMSRAIRVPALAAAWPG